MRAVSPLRAGAVDPNRFESLGPPRSGDQPALFYESFTDALREVVRVCGGSKAVGALLWPEKAPDAAARLLLDCLNDSRSERLTPDQVLLLGRLGRERGCHAVMHFLGGELGYEVKVRAVEDEATELRRLYVESARRMAVIAERIERLESSR